MKLGEEFWKFAFPIPECGCWIWMGALNYKTWGYGQFNGRKLGLKTKLAHRLSYEDKNGPIPIGMHLDHLCRIPECINPDHLEPVTCKINLQRGRNKNREKTHCIRGHRFSAENTYYGKYKGKPTRSCNICRRMRRRKSWRNEKV